MSTWIVVNKLTQNCDGAWRVVGMDGRELPSSVLLFEQTEVILFRAGEVWYIWFADGRPCQERLL